MDLEIDDDESDFGADDEVSICIMSSAKASLINGDVYSNDERVGDGQEREVLASTNIEMEF